MGPEHRHIHHGKSHVVSAGDCLDEVSNGALEDRRLRRSWRQVCSRSFQAMPRCSTSSICLDSPTTAWPPSSTTSPPVRPPTLSESDNSAASRLTCLCCGAVRPALFCGMVCGVLNELAWKVSAWRKLKAFAALPPEERAAAIARYDFCERQPSSLRHAQLRCSWCALAAAMTGAQLRNSR